MNYDRVYWLAERYWAGNTSVEEENELRDFLLQKEVPADLLSLKSQFLAYNELSGIRISDDFEQKLFSAVETAGVTEDEENQTEKTLQVNRKRLFYWVSAVAASLIILLTVWATTGIFNKNTSLYQNNKALAYKQAAAALSVLAVNFDKGLSQTQQAAKPLNMGIKMLNNVGMVNKGIENLKPINKISNLEIIKYNHNH